MSKRLKIGLIYGGKSGEHEVSLRTALAVIQAFDYSKYEISPFYITTDGLWRKGTQISAPLETVEQLRLRQKIDAAPSAPSAPSEQPAPTETSHVTIAEASAVQPLFESQLDVVFPLLHGTYGEDGTVQGLLEMADIPYVGAGVLASAVGMDKVVMKKLFSVEKLPQCRYLYFKRKQWNEQTEQYIAEIEGELGYPCFVKPANAGSSVGISKVKAREQLVEAVATALRYDEKIIVEEHIDAREIELSVLGNDELEVSIPGEIVPSNEFYDYKAKYLDGDTALIIPPLDLSEDIVATMKDMAVKAFRAIEGSGLARVDFFLRKSDQAIFINEINTMPGFTPVSMYPLLWRESGKAYSTLLDQLIQLAIERYNEKKWIEYDFEHEG